MKKIITGILTLSILLSVFATNVFAATPQEKVISYNEYYTAMKTLYAQYGVKYEILKKNSDVVLTESLLEKQLNSAKQQLEIYAETSSNTTVINMTPQSNIASSGDVSINSLMPYAYSYTQNYRINSPSGMGYACFNVTLKATADAQYSTFLSINSYTCKQAGSYMNFKSWTQTSKSYRLSQANQLCIMNFIGNLTVEYTEPNTGMLVGYTSRHNIMAMFAAYW